MTHLELLAPARNIEIGIAAIDCGADAVYIAGPGFGARQAASNSIEDIKKLCSYAHKFGVRIYITLNTILFEDELAEAEKMLKDCIAAGANGFIVQDLAVTSFAPEGTPLHASTQCAIRDVQTAKIYENFGFSRLVLEREMSLERMREIHEAVDCELEFFIHGALCVCYSGQCYLSEYLTGRSANRGSCIQACRSRYDLLDGNGKVLVKDKALLSLKDYNLSSRLGDLAEAGVCSFKIEGRLKNISYVINTVSHYSEALDEVIAAHPDKYARASFGRVKTTFQPDLEKTFNRGYTELFIDGKRGRWASPDTPKSIGETIGKVTCIDRRGDRMTITIDLANGKKLGNGDGFSYFTDHEYKGFRGDICRGNTIECHYLPDLKKGMQLFRNLSSEFEKKLAGSKFTRLIPVKVDMSFSGNADKGFQLTLDATSQDGRYVQYSQDCGKTLAENPDRVKAMAISQICKSADQYAFIEGNLDCGDNLPLVKAADFNAARHAIAQLLNKEQCHAIPLRNHGKTNGASVQGELTYKANVANSIAKSVWEKAGASKVEKAYELTHRDGAELMRSKYCIKYELGLCPIRQGAKNTGPLFLLNNGKKLALHFDCANCEMVVSESQPQK